MKKLLIGLLAMSMVSCASMGKFTPEGAAIATNVVNVATGLLHSLDNFYDDLLTLKMVPDYQTTATRALSMADAAAVTLKKAIAGATVTDKELNIAAGMVDGSRAILKAVK